MHSYHGIKASQASTFAVPPNLNAESPGNFFFVLTIMHSMAFKLGPVSVEWTTSGFMDAVTEHP